MSKLLHLLFMILIIPFLLSAKEEEVAEDFLLLDPQISAIYDRGEYLLYNCNDKHWVCTRKVEFDQCERLRKSAIADNMEFLPCVGIKKYEKVEKCITEQKRVTYNGVSNRFCLHPKRSKDELSF